MNKKILLNNFQKYIYNYTDMIIRYILIYCYRPDDASPVKLTDDKKITMNNVSAKQKNKSKWSKIKCYVAKV